MSVFVTGDIHGDPRRLNTGSFYEQKQFSGDQDENIVIILGDFGLIWSPRLRKQTREILFGLVRTEIIYNCFRRWKPRKSCKAGNISCKTMARRPGTRNQTACVASYAWRNV